MDITFLALKFKKYFQTHSITRWACEEADINGHREVSLLTNRSCGIKKRVDWGTGKTSFGATSFPLLAETYRTLSTMRLTVNVTVHCKVYLVLVYGVHRHVHARNYHCYSAYSKWHTLHADKHGLEIVLFISHRRASGDLQSPLEGLLRIDDKSAMKKFLTLTAVAVNK